MAHQVFLSHATEDRDVATQVCAALEADGIFCWIAPRDVKAGTDYAAAILDAIRTSDLVLLVFSSFADSSPYVLREIERAVNYKRPVLALRMDDSAPSASIEYYVNLWQKLDATDGIEQKNDEIIAAVRGAIAAPGTAGGARPGGARRTRILRRWSRRKWGIALASLLVVAAVGLGLGFGLTRAPTAAGVSAMHGQITWSELHPPGTLPTPRYGQEMAQDPTSGRLIMFGGYADGTALNDTWAYDPAANTWADLTPSGPLPSVRGSAAMVYDPSTRRIIMFGGDAATRFNDTWAYDPVGNTWTDLSPAGPVPAGRGGHVMVYDPSSGRILMFGGRVGDMDFLNDMWAFDGAANTWTRLSPDGDLPAVRGYASMAYDPAARRMILFGGQNLETEFGDTWAYDSVANKWTELHPLGTLPTPRSGQDLVCDPSRVVLIMFGGSYDPGTGLALDYFNETWTYDPFANIWTRLAPLHGAAPSRRSGQSVVYDPSGGRLIMFGGNSSMDAYLDDTYACKL